jgi:3-oxoacyl-[acyl-carrier-protein] synthase II
MAPSREIVITGLGVVSPIGLGREPFWQSLLAGRSGISTLTALDFGQVTPPIGGQVGEFDPKLYVTPRKSLKVMSREIQMGFTAARLALEDAALQAGGVDPDLFGVVFGADMIYCDPEELAPAVRSCIPNGKFDFNLWGQRAMGEMFPLWMLKFLPNMPACHIAIANDARGPNNSVLAGEASSLLAFAEAMRVIQRGLADVMIAGGTACRIHPMSLLCRDERLMSSRRFDPTRAMRPFDAARDGVVYGEGAAAFVLETREHARARGRRPLARVVEYASAFEAPRRGESPRGTAIRTSIAQVLRKAGVDAREIDHVNANGQSDVLADRVESAAIRDLLGDVPVTAPKSFFGNLGAATGAVEMAASVLALVEGRIPVTLNYEHPDVDCPVRVVHGDSQASSKRFALVLSQSTTGQAAAVLLARPDESE